MGSNGKSRPRHSHLQQPTRENHLNTHKAGVVRFYDTHPINEDEILAKLREQKLVTTRKDAQSVFYRVSDPKALQLLSLLHDLFCPDLGGAGATEPNRS